MVKTNNYLPMTRQSIMQQRNKRIVIDTDTQQITVKNKRAWWNPKTWWDATSVSYNTDGKHHFYNVTNPQLGKFNSCFKGPYSEINMMEMFLNIPEVFAPIDLIAQTVSNGNFVLRRKSTDEIVINNAAWNALQAKPNWRTNWRRFIYHAVVFKYVCGNRYLYKNLPGTLKPKLDNISALWWMPSQYMWPIAKDKRPKFFTTTKASDIIDHYELRYFDDSSNFVPYLINHDTFLDLSIQVNQSYLKGISPLRTAEMPMSNLLAVYEARNVIYTKKGALGYLVSAKTDDSGSVALTTEDKKQMREEMQMDFGVTGGRDILGVIDNPVEYVDVAMSIRNLEPFTETRADAAAIYGVLGVDFDLAPGPDGNTFENKKGAMRKLYQDVSIPEGNQIADIITDACGMLVEDLYLDVSYDHIEVLQTDKGAEATTEKTVNETKGAEYQAGLITKNDWRNALNIESKDGDDIYIGDIKVNGEPLASKIGVGGVTALMQVLVSTLSPESKASALEIIFGLSPADAAKMSTSNPTTINSNNNEDSNIIPEGTKDIRTPAQSSAN